MFLKISREDTYVPRWRGNDTLKEDEQIKITFHYMTADQEERYTKFKPIYRGTAIDKLQEVEMSIETHANDIWDGCVTKVSGLFDDETKKEITNPVEVRKIPGIYGLITETVAFIKRGIEEIDEKN